MTADQVVASVRILHGDTAADRLAARLASEATS